MFHKYSEGPWLAVVKEAGLIDNCRYHLSGREVLKLGVGWVEPRPVKIEDVADSICFYLSNEVGRDFLEVLG